MKEFSFGAWVIGLGLFIVSGTTNSTLAIWTGAMFLVWLITLE